MEVTFEVIGEPKGKQRPRFARTGKFTRAYTPKETVQYENYVRLSYLNAVGETKLEGAIAATIIGIFPIPKSVSKKQRELMRTGKILHTKKCDADNLAKCIADGLNGIAYDDDKQICKLYVEKKYGEEPKVIVTLKELEN